MGNKILVIEDDPATARLITIALERKGYQVYTGKNGLEGLQLAHQQSPDLILLDLMLPGIDGFEVLSQLRNNAQTAKIPVIVVSAKTQPKDKELAKELGANGYLTKPYRIRELAELAETLIPQTLPAPVFKGTLMVVVGSRPAESAAVAVYTGLALAQFGRRPVTVVDPRPYSVEHLLLLDMPPQPAPTALSPPSIATLLDHALREHVSGLRLLNNLVGNGDFGQLTTHDLYTLSSIMGEREQLTLFDLPANPPQALEMIAPQSQLVLLVTQDHPAALAAMRTTLDLLTQIKVPKTRIALALVDPSGQNTMAALGLPTLGKLPQLAAGNPQIEILAERLLAYLEALP